MATNSVALYDFFGARFFLGEIVLYPDQASLYLGRVDYVDETGTLYLKPLYGEGLKTRLRQPGQVIWVDLGIGAIRLEHMPRFKANRLKKSVDIQEKEDKIE